MTACALVAVVAAVSSSGARMMVRGRGVEASGTVRGMLGADGRVRCAGGSEPLPAPAVSGRIRRVPRRARS